MNKLNVLFIGGLYSDNQMSIYKENSKVGLQFAAQNLQESLIEGLRLNNVSVTVLSKPILSTFPHGYKKIKVYDAPFVFKSTILGKSLGFINLPFLNFPLESQYEKEIDNWYRQYEGPKEIWVYSLNRRFMEIAINAKRIYPNLKILLIAPDLPRFMGCNKYYKKLGFQKRDILKIYTLVKFFDKYVLICKNMATDLEIQDKPYIVIEGIFSPEYNSTVAPKDPNKTILYTGNLDSRYGIINLLDAFSLIKDKSFRLWIRGNGSTESIVKERIRSDNRIKIIPQLSKADLIRLEKQASLLINPVSYNQEFTNYFFPSKTMDYLASGTPTMMHKLRCLPEDYQKHIKFFLDDTPKNMARDIYDFFAIDEIERQEFGIKAQQFILNEKTPYKQIRKILNMKKNDKQ